MFPSGLLVDDIKCLCFSFMFLGKVFLICVLEWLSHDWLFVTPWTLAHPAPLSMGFSSQDYWSGLPFPPPGDLAGPGIGPTPPALAGGFFTNCTTCVSDIPGKRTGITLSSFLPLRWIFLSPSWPCWHFGSFCVLTSCSWSVWSSWICWKHVLVLRVAPPPHRWDVQPWAGTGKLENLHLMDWKTKSLLSNCLLPAHQWRNHRHHIITIITRTEWTRLISRANHSTSQ